MKDAVTHVGTYKDLCTKVVNIENCSLGHQRLGVAVRRDLLAMTQTLGAEVVTQQVLYCTE